MQIVSIVAAAFFARAYAQGGEKPESTTTVAPASSTTTTVLKKCEEITSCFECGVRMNDCHYCGKITGASTTTTTTTSPTTSPTTSSTPTTQKPGGGAYAAMFATIEGKCQPKTVQCGEGVEEIEVTNETCMADITCDNCLAMGLKWMEITVAGKTTTACVPASGCDKIPGTKCVDKCSTGAAAKLISSAAGLLAASTFAFLL